MPLADLVAVTEDLYTHERGCDAISIFHVSTGEAIEKGTTYASPGRVVATSDFTRLFAPTANGTIKTEPGYVPISDYSQFLYALSIGSATTTSAVYGEGFATLSGIAVTQDNRSLYVGTSKYEVMVESYRTARSKAPFGMAKIPIGRTAAGLQRSERAVAKVVLPGVPFWIHPSHGDSVVHVITDRWTVHSFDPGLSREVAASFSIPPVSGLPSTVLGTKIDYAHASIGPDEQFVVVNQGDLPSLTVADLAGRRAISVLLTGVSHAAGISINRGWDNAGLLAVHGGDVVAVYKFVPPEQPTFLSQVQVRAPACWTPWDQVPSGPRCSIAWSASGRELIAATDRGSSEFIVIDVLDNGLTLAPARYLTACPHSWNMPNGIFTLNGLITPTATPTSAVTATPIPSATPTVTPPPTHTAMALASATPSPTASATASPTATATRLPAPVCLPLVLTESCTPTQRHVDAALVLDASSSMLAPTSAGRSKLAAAIEAARVFLDQLQLAAGDQAAVVAFNSDAVLLAPLGDDRSALDRALGAITTAQYTRLDRGIAVAGEALASTRRRPDNTAVMVVLTDGRANPVPVAVAVAEAERVKAAGVQVFTVGLGLDVEAEALAGMASRPEWYHEAPDAEDLAAVYRAIAVTIPCPAAAFWGRR